MSMWAFVSARTLAHLFAFVALMVVSMPTPGISGNGPDVYLRKSCSVTVLPVGTIDSAKQQHLQEIARGGSYSTPLFWQERIVAHRARVKGWSLGSSTIAGQDLAQVSLDKAASRGGILKFVTRGNFQGYDLHAASRSAAVLTLAPFYSLLVRADPNQPRSVGHFECDLCTGSVPRATDNGLRYRFYIRKNVRFHDGTSLTARDIVATFNKIIFPASDEQSELFEEVASIEAPDAFTVDFNLRHPSDTFIAKLAMPFNVVYAAQDINRQADWHVSNINGTGPFAFVQHQPGAFIEGKRHDAYHVRSLPYLDGFRGIFAPKYAVRVQAIRGNRAEIDFLGFAGKEVERLVNDLGNRITVQRGPSTCLFSYDVASNSAPFADEKMRHALATALDVGSIPDRIRNVANLLPYNVMIHPSDPVNLWGRATPDSLLGGTHPDRLRKAQDVLSRVGRTLRLSHPRDDATKAVAHWLASQWKSAGLAVKIETIDSNWKRTMRRAGIDICPNCGVKGETCGSKCPEACNKNCTKKKNKKKYCCKLNSKPLPWPY